MTPTQLANLQPGRKPSGKPVRTVHASARLTQGTKERLTIILDEMNMNLADLLEKIADGQIEIVEKVGYNKI